MVVWFPEFMGISPETAIQEMWHRCSSGWRGGGATLLRLSLREVGGKDVIIVSFSIFGSDNLRQHGVFNIVMGIAVAAVLSVWLYGYNVVWGLSVRQRDRRCGREDNLRVEDVL